MWRQFFLTGVFLLWVTHPAWAQKQLLDRIVAVVNDEAITQSELDLYLRPLYDEFKQQYEGSELMQKLSEARLKLLNQMIEDRLVFQEAKARQITVDETEIDTRVKEFKRQFSSEGEFERVLVAEGYNLTKLRERYQREIAIRKLHDLEIRSRVVISPLEIEKYYKDHKSEFAEEEKIKVRSITLRKSTESIEKGLTDEAVKANIESIEKEIWNGESFEKLAREFSEDAHATEGGVVGWMKRGETLPKIDESLFGLAPGGISPVLETSMGYHLFKVEEKQASRVPSLEKVRDQIRGILYRKEAQRRFDEWMNELKRRAYISVR